MRGYGALTRARRRPAGAGGDRPKRRASRWCPGVPRRLGHRQPGADRPQPRAVPLGDTRRSHRREVDDRVHGQGRRSGCRRSGSLLGPIPPDAHRVDGLLAGAGGAGTWVRHADEVDGHRCLRPPFRHPPVRYWLHRRQRCQSEGVGEARLLPPMAIDASSAKMVRLGPNISWFSSPPTTSTRMMRSSSPAPRLFADSSASNRIQRSHNAHE